jgi:signal transduction histidine kinase
MDGNTRKSILLVDDDVFVLDSASLLLGSYGNSVTPAHNAADALARFRESAFDTVVTDIRMPGDTGIVLLEKIHELNPDIPVILMTAYADLDVAIDAVKKGAFDFIVKPYQPEQFIHSVEKALKYNRLIRVEKEYRHILEEFNQEMETLVAERTMGLMALTLADRVRNPAAAIGGIGRRLLEKEDLPEKARGGLEDIVMEAEKLDVIVKDFNTLLRNRQSMFSYEDINDIVGGVLAFIGEEAAGRKVGLEVHLARQPLKINVQKNLLRVAIFHVMRNALEATPPGGHVFVTTSGNDGTVCLTITDTGSGIPPEDLPRVFDPFFSTKQHKFGMGLPLVKQIVTEHLGEIGVKSGPGMGALFTMTFPSHWIEKSAKGGKTDGPLPLADYLSAP